ncbi:MAG TPA: zinc ribbon domain-containing protein [Terriglobales bacterium]|nr:zinc ribbon domain-containing protein [Terriglobales bacterium]
MPIFEYICKDCGARFEAIVHGTRKPECPHCRGKKLEQQLSVFSVGAPKGARPAAGPCGSCGDPRGPGACNLN